MAYNCMQPKVWHVIRAGPRRSKRGPFTVEQAAEMFPQAAPDLWSAASTMICIFDEYVEENGCKLVRRSLIAI